MSRFMTYAICRREESKAINGRSINKHTDRYMQFRNKHKNIPRRVAALKMIMMMRTEQGLNNRFWGSSGLHQGPSFCCCQEAQKRTLACPALFLRFDRPRSKVTKAAPQVIMALLESVGLAGCVRRGAEDTEGVVCGDDPVTR